MKTNQSLFCALLQVAVLLSFVSVAGFAESQVTVSMRPYKSARAIVAVKVNGAGPYDFMVDTGATVTVLDSALFSELGLRPEGLSNIVGTGGTTTSQIRSVVQEITVDCLAVRNITVVSLPVAVPGPDYGAVRGILGENFLRHFDILIDNEHRKVTLDAADGLANSLSGERLPITFVPLSEGEDNRYRPTIAVRAEAFGHASVLLDSGAAAIMLLQWGGGLKGYGRLMRLTTVNGSMTCQAADDWLHLGKRLVHNLSILKCQSAIVKPRDREGILPTAIFKQIFISHAGCYAIIEPVREPVRGFNVPQEIAVVTPLPQ